MNKRETGAVYEERAAAYLIQHGFQILEKNFYCRQGEIDLVGIHGEYLVFVEVKYRKSKGKGLPEEAVTAAKQKKICRASDFYRSRNRHFFRYQVRYDVVAILGEEISWYQNAFHYTGACAW